jgi:hypothetical protein
MAEKVGSAEGFRAGERLLSALRVIPVAFGP